MTSPVVSIGVLAHNEGRAISATLRSLFAQDLFALYATEIVVVANGCSDDTVRAALQAIEDSHELWTERGTARVENVVIAGKANAWNQFVHRFSANTARFLVLMDADISFLHGAVISSMLATLQTDEHALICVDRAVKEFELKAHRTVFERLLSLATPTIDSDNVPLCGQLYCAHSAALRSIELPEGISVDDGFVRALLLTDSFTTTAEPRRIVLDQKAAHSFRTVQSVFELYSHERWLVAGTIVNMLLFERFVATASTDRNAVALMRAWRQEDPAWLTHFVEAEVSKRGWRLLPKAWWIRRWKRFAGATFGQRLLRSLVSALASTVDAMVFLAAIADVRGGRALRYWRQPTRTDSRPQPSSTIRG